MVITTVFYGLGNQLFQYAAARAVSIRCGAPLWADATYFTYSQSRPLDLTRFRVCLKRLPHPLAKLLTRTPNENRLKGVLKGAVASAIPTFNDPEKGYDPRVETLGWFSRLDGLWQSERYFTGIRPQLLAELEPREPLSAELAEWIRRVAAEPSVALHVRRGDLVSDEDYAQTVGSLGPAYYAEALERLRARQPDARVYVFSDDPAWCAENLPTVLPLEIVSGTRTRSAVEDFVAMKACRHFIIANSTFSWWTAWLGDQPGKQVIAPARFFRVPRTWEVDLLPSSWETIEPTFSAAGS